MNFEDTQHFKILKALEYSNGKEISNDEAKNIFKNCFGNSSEEVFYAMKELKLIECVTRKKNDGNYDHTTFVTANGIAKFNLLSRQNRNKLIRTIAFWILFGASIISAVYAVLGYYFIGESNNQTLQKTEIPQEQQVTNLPQTKIPDSTSGLQIYSDTLTKKQSDSNLDDTAALRHNPKQLK